MCPKCQKAKLRKFFPISVSNFAQDIIALRYSSSRRKIRVEQENIPKQ